MLKFLLKRLFHAIFIIWGVLSLIFLLIHLAPGDPTTLYIRPDISPEIVADLRQSLGLDLPLWRQYFLWLPRFLCGNFGVSISHHRFVSELMIEAIPNTIQLTSVVFVIQFILGIFLGISMAVNHHHKIEVVLNGLLLLFYSIPSFWLALMAIMVFSLNLGWLPSSHMQSMNIGSDTWSILLDRIKHLILPASVLIIPFTAYTAQYVHRSLVDVLQTEYIRCNRAYGLSEKQILWKYGLKNALLPQATLIGLYLPFLLGGAVITEFIFSWPGMGRLTINAIFAHDFPVILACTLMAALAVVVGNLISDVLYALLDPRIKGSN